MLKTILSDLKTLKIELKPFMISEAELRKIDECLIYKYLVGEQLNEGTLELVIISKTNERNQEILKSIFDLFIKREDRVDIKYANVQAQVVTSEFDTETKTVNTLLHLDFVGKIYE